MSRNNFPYPFNLDWLCDLMWEIKCDGSNLYLMKQGLADLKRLPCCLECSLFKASHYRRSLTVPRPSYCVEVQASYMGKQRSSKAENKHKNEDLPWTLQASRTSTWMQLSEWLQLSTQGTKNTSKGSNIVKWENGLQSGLLVQIDYRWGSKGPEQMSNLHKANIRLYL